MKFSIGYLACLLILSGLEVQEPKRPEAQEPKPLGDKPVRVDFKTDPEVLKIITGLKLGESVLLPPVKTAGAINEEICCFDPRFDLNQVEPLPQGVKGRDRSITVCSRT
jgi:hypothetical protein